MDTNCTHCGLCGNRIAYCLCLNAENYFEVSRFRFSIDIQKEVLNYLPQVNTLDNGLQGSIKKWFNGRLDTSNYRILCAGINEHILQAVQTYEKSNNINTDIQHSNFVTRPWQLSSTVLSSTYNFKGCFLFKSREVIISNHKSKLIDNILGTYFNSTQLYKSLILEANGDIVLPVFAQPDGVWLFENQMYTIEFKTVKHISLITREKVDEWLRQIACYQLPPHDGVDEYHQNMRYLLVIIIIDNKSGYKSMVLEVTKDNLRHCLGVWNKWFRDLYLREVKVNLLRDYSSNSMYLQQNSAKEHCSSSSSSSSSSCVMNMIQLISFHEQQKQLDNQLRQRQIEDSEQPQYNAVEKVSTKSKSSDKKKGQSKSNNSHSNNPFAALF